MGEGVASINWNSKTEQFELWVCTERTKDGGSYKKIGQFSIASLLRIVQPLTKE